MLFFLASLVFAAFFSAFIDIADYILTAENGWRKGPTYVIALSTAQEYNISESPNQYQWF